MAKSRLDVFITFNDSKFTISHKLADKEIPNEAMADIASKNAIDAINYYFDNQTPPLIADAGKATLKSHVIHDPSSEKAGTLLIPTPIILQKLRLALESSRHIATLQAIKCFLSDNHATKPTILITSKNILAINHIRKVMAKAHVKSGLITSTTYRSGKRKFDYDDDNANNKPSKKKQIGHVPNEVKPTSTASVLTALGISEMPTCHTGATTPISASDTSDLSGTQLSPVVEFGSSSPEAMLPDRNDSDMFQSDDNFVSRTPATPLDLQLQTVPVISDAPKNDIDAPFPDWVDPKHPFDTLIEDAQYSPDIEFSGIRFRN